MVVSSVFADYSQCTSFDSSDEGMAPIRLTSPVEIEPKPHCLPPPSTSIGKQTPGTLLDHVQELAERMSITLVHMNPIRDQFWLHVLSCIKMPRGGSMVEAQCTAPSSSWR